MDDVLLGVECVDDTIIADAEAVPIRTLQAVVRKSGEAKSHVVNLGSDAVLSCNGQFEELRVEPRVINL
jgi:hypothetical protein